MIRIFFFAALLAIPVFAEAADRQLAHMVFFTLAEDTPENQQKLVAACDKYLTGHDGTVYYSAGSIAQELDREVNDREFDVALHLVFENRAAHDKYQTHPRHLKFIEENKQLWSNVRVFDSYVAPGDAGLPQAARGFAGMLSGKIASKTGSRIVLVVSEVGKVWKPSRARNPQSLVGCKVTIDGSRADQIVRFVEGLKVGEVVTLDVANREGGVLTILELTADQRQRVKQ